jgi:glycosyltransferase involved in cell wall biosynthesis
MTRICLVPKLTSLAGPASFQAKLATGLGGRGIDTCFDLNDTPYQAILVIAGTRHLPGLWQAKRKGIPIVQRLDGMNWIHRLRRTGIRHYIRSEYGNWLIATIRSRLADRIVYQSEFVRQWWQREYGALITPSSIIYNAVDLNLYTPRGPHQRPADRHRLLLVEGSLTGGHEVGIETAVGLVECLNQQYSAVLEKPVELMIVGKVTQADREYWNEHTAIDISWQGIVPRQRIPEFDRSAHLLYPAEINAACPNAVIEAMACGLPVVATSTGSLPELVANGAGRVVPYGGNPWKLDPPDIPALAEAAADILQNQDTYRPAARSHAEANFRLEQMVDRYLSVLFG